jgi:hypothetical protein
MALFSWDITEGIPVALPGSGGVPSGTFSVDVEEFDIAFGNLPFLLDIGPEHKYERSSVQLRKEQFDAQNQAGEQSLQGWWLRSQSAFYGGAGIRYYEPIQGEGSETRFHESSGVEVFNDDGTVNLLKDTELGPDAVNADIEIVAGPNRLLQRDGGTLSVWDGATETAVTGTASASSLAYTGANFLVADNGNIYVLGEAAGTALPAAKYTGGTGPLKVWWVKDRIIAADGPVLYELTLAGSGALPGTPLYTHPDSGWEWVEVTETGGAIWAAGYSGERSAVHAFEIANTGATPTLSAGTVAIQLPETEIVHALKGYIGFLLLGTSDGFRVALTDQANTALGPLIWRDKAVLSVGARGDYAYTGHASGTTRKVDLSNEIAGELGFAYTEHLAAGAGDVKGILWFQGREHLAVASAGTYREHATRLVASGSIATGRIRFGTVENKHIETVRVGLDATGGSTVAVLHEHDGHDPTTISTLGEIDGYVDLYAQHSQTLEHFTLRFQLNRSDTDDTVGPTLNNYQLRALPAPTRRQRLLRFPLKLNDWERNRQGVSIGGEGFAYARQASLEQLEALSEVVLMRDLRTGEARRVMIEQVAHEGEQSPDRSRPNFGGRTWVTVRTLGTL